MSATWSIIGLCRCCHSEGSFRSLGVAYPFEGTDEIYSLLLRETFNIIIKKKYGTAGPSMNTICDSCIIRLRDAAAFKRQVDKCETMFKEFYNYSSKNTPPQQLNERNQIIDHNYCKEYTKEEITSNITSKCTDDVTVCIANDIPSREKIQNNCNIDRLESKDARKLEIKVINKIKSNIFTCNTSSNITLECTDDVTVCNDIPTREKIHNNYNIEMLESKDARKLEIKDINKIKSNILTSNTSSNITLKCTDDVTVCNDIPNREKIQNNYNIERLESKDARKLEIKDINKIKSYIFTCKNSSNNTLKFTYDVTVRNDIPSREKIENNYNIERLESKDERKLDIEDINKIKSNIVTCNTSSNITSKCTDDITVRNDIPSREKIQNNYNIERLESKDERKLEIKDINKIKSNIFICNTCFKQFDNKNDFVEHIVFHKSCRIGKSETNLNCSECSYKTSDKADLDRHMMYHDLYRKYVCDVCGYRFKQESYLLDHLKSCSIEKPSSLSKKNLIFSEKPFPKSRPKEKKINCQLCNRKFDKNSSLLAHMRSHTGEKPYSCHLCKRSFSSSSTLKHHLMGHRGEKPHSCPFCDYKCCKKGNLNIHLKVHTGEKPYSCTVCNLKFSQKCQLTVHSTIHSDVKAFSCSLCDYRGRNKCLLTSHLITHSSERPFACTECPLKFGRKDILRRHLRVHNKPKSEKNKKSSTKITTKTSGFSTDV